jgi:hypothetical protein
MSSVVRLEAPDERAARALLDELAGLGPAIAHASDSRAVLEVRLDSDRTLARVLHVLETWLAHTSLAWLHVQIDNRTYVLPGPM